MAVHPRTCWALAGFQCRACGTEIECVPDEGYWCRTCSPEPYTAPSLLGYWYQILTFKRRTGQSLQPWSEVMT